MRTMSLLLAASFFGALLTACNNSGQRAESDTINVAQRINDSTAMVSEDDAEFAVKAADACLADIHLAKLALEKASDDRIKELATTIVEEHEQIHQELAELAEKHNITLPPAPSPDQVDNQRELTDKSGAEFDRSYIAMVTDEHHDVVSLYEDAAEDAQHPEMQSFASSTLPKLERHQAHLVALRDAMVPRADPVAVPVVRP